MTKLTYEKYAIPSASLGEDSALADIHVNSYIRANISVSESISEEDSQYIGKGMISTLLPYRITDGYDRSREIRHFESAVLKNVYIHFKEVVCGKQTFAVSRENHWSSWNLVNVMTVTDKLTAMDGVLNPQFFALGIVRHKYYKPSLTQYCSVVNCAAVCSPANGVTVNGWMEQPDSSSEWTTTDATPTLDDLNEVQSKWDSSFWTVTDGVPAPKNLLK